MSRYGIVIAEDGHTVTDKPAKLDSRQPHLIVDLERDPSHLQFLNPMVRAPYVDSSDGLLHNQLVGQPIKHGLGYTPLVFAYFQLLDFDGPPGANAFNTVIGGYSGDFYNIGGTGAVTDFFTWEADKNEVRIIEKVENPFATDPFFPLSYTSSGQYYKFRVKLYICSVDIGVDFIDGLNVLS
jgi:hypothetical protein